MRKFSLLLAACCMTLAAWSQSYPVVSIQDIQTVSPDSLAACIGRTPYLNDTVITYGVVMMDARITTAGGAVTTNAQGVQSGNRNIWLQNGTGPYSGLDLFTTTGTPVPVPGTDVLDLVAGDSVRVTGVIIEFNGETEITPLNIEVLAFGKPVVPTAVNLSDLNDNLRVNKLTTGEQWEGVYIELYNVTVATVDPFSNGTRIGFNVEDANGNRMNVSDRFMAQRQSNWTPPGTFVAPTVGTVYDTLRGVVAHSQNGCAGTGRGYELFPFRSDDYVVVAGTAAPQISGFSRNPITPTGAQDVSVFATITDVDGTVTSANLFYAVGVSNATYLSVPMTASGSTYAGTIPNTAFSDGDIVKYYVGATDNDNLTAYSPNIPGGTANPLFFAVRDNGTTIYDVQFTPFNNGNSAYSSLDVTVEGIVTASAQSGDLGYVYIQQPGQTQWAGLSLVQNSGLANLKRGDEVRVTGKIEENFGFTRMAVSNLSVLGENRPLPAPVVLDPALFSTYDFAVNEAYESMVVKLKNPAANKGIVVVDENADASQFGEYRVGSSILDPLSGCRVLAGRVTNTAFSSLNFSYVNDAQWATTDGIMNVTSCVVVPGDTMASLTGIMHYSFNNMKLFPRNNADAELFNGTNCPGGVSGIDLLPGTELTLYPNPASSQITLDFTFPRIVRGTVTLSDLTGRQVLRQPILGEAGRVEMSTAHLAAGAYLMTVAEQGVIIAREKLIIVQ